MRRLIIFSCFLFATLAYSQATYWRWDGSLQNSSGQAIGGAKVYVYDQATGALATLYANNTGTALPVNCGVLSGVGNQINNPITTNGFGEVCAYLTAGCFTMTYVSATTGTRTYTDQGPGCLGVGTFVPISGGSMTGTLTNSFGFVGPLTGAASLNVLKSGDTMTGPLVAPEINGVYSCPTSSTLAACLSNLPSSGGTLVLTTGTYASGFSGSFATACMSKPNVTILGAGTPQFNSGNTALTGGTIVQGPIWICANNIAVSNLGVDNGSALGVLNEGLMLDGPNNGTESPSDPILVGATVSNVVSLGEGVNSPVHAFLIEHYTDVSLTNLEARLDQHCYAIKSSNVTASNLKAQGCAVDAITFKGDAYTQLSNIALSNVVVRDYTNAGDTNGIQIVATESTGTVSGVTISNYTGYGVLDGVTLTNSSTVGAGALSNVTLNNLNFTLLDTSAFTPTIPTCLLSAGSSNINNVNVNTLLCNVNDTAQAVAPIAFDLGLNNSTLNNLTLIGGGFASDIEGTVTINGINDYGAASSQKTIFDQVSGSTVLYINGWQSTRGNAPFDTNVGATAYVLPPATILTYGGGAIVNAAGPLHIGGKFTATDPGGSDTINAFSNTGGGADYVQSNATSSPYAVFESINNASDWIAGQFGTTDYSITDHSSGNVMVGKFAKGAPANSLYIQATGQPQFSYLSGTGTSCIQADSAGNITRTGAGCGGGGGSGTVTSFAAPSGSWPTWLVPTVTNATTTPSLAVAASAIPNAALANSATTVNGVTCTLGSTCTTGIADVTITTGTTSVPAGDCLPAKAGAGTSQSMTNLASTSAMFWSPNVDVVNINGFGPGGSLYLSITPGSGSFTWRLCNANLAAAVVPGSSVTWNVGAR